MLEWRRVGNVHVALLSAPVHLQRLVIKEKHYSSIDIGILLAGPDEPRLSVLTGLTELQHLQLPVFSGTQPGVVAISDAADFAAISASAS